MIRTTCTTSMMALQEGLRPYEELCHAVQSFQGAAIQS